MRMVIAGWSVGVQVALEVVGRHPHGDAVALDHADAVLAHLAVQPAQHLVATVALLAAGGMGIIHQQCLAMYPALVISHGLFVTVSTINRGQFFRMGESFIGRIGVTGDTGIAVMHGMLENHGIHKHGDIPPIQQPPQVRILMAHHAVFIGLRQQ